MYTEEVRLGVEKASSFDSLIGVEVIFLSEFGEGELVLVAGDPVSKGGHGYFCLESSAHCSNCHIQSVALVVVGESCEDELWGIRCFGKLAVRKALLAGAAKIELDSIFLEGSCSAFDDFFRRIAVRTGGWLEFEVLENGSQGFFLCH